MLTALRRYWKQAFNYRGYATVSDYWWIALWVLIITTPFVVISIYATISDIGVQMQQSADTWN